MSMTLVSTVTVGSGGAASIDFTGISGSATDLVLVTSFRSSGSSQTAGFNFNNDTGSNYSYLRMHGVNGTVFNSIAASSTIFYSFHNSVSTDTSNTFGNGQIYIPNYSGSTAKSISNDSITENNAAASAITNLSAGRWNSTSAITSIQITPADGNFVQHSTASLYLITKGSGGATTSP